MVLYVVFIYVCWCVNICINSILYIPHNTANTALFQIRLRPIRDCEAWTVSYHTLTLLCIASHPLSS